MKWDSNNSVLTFNSLDITPTELGQVLIWFADNGHPLNWEVNPNFSQQFKSESGHSVRANPRSKNVFGLTVQIVDDLNLATLFKLAF